MSKLPDGWRSCKLNYSYYYLKDWTNYDTDAYFDDGIIEGVDDLMLLLYRNVNLKSKRKAKLPEGWKSCLI